MSDQQLIEIFNRQHEPEQRELIIVCQCRQKVRLTTKDRWALCPHCQQALVTISGVVEQADAYRQGGRREESWTINNRQWKMHLKEPSGIAVGNQITAVYRATAGAGPGRELGVADHSRRLWLSAAGKRDSEPRMLLWRITSLAAVLAAGGYFFSQFGPELLFLTAGLLLLITIIVDRFSQE